MSLKSAFQLQKPLILLFLLTLTISSCQNNDELDITSAAEFEKFISDEMDYQKMPATALLIFKGDNVLYESYLGKSDLEKDLDLNDNHLFLLASISKTITAAALLQLYENGHFELDDDINDHLSFKASLPGRNTAITFRMLLTHTSGIADGSALDDQYYYGQDSPITLKSFLMNYLTPNGSYYNASENFHNFEPGSKHEYSNIGSALIGLLVEEIANKDFSEYCKENIFMPLAMNNTYWHLDEILRSNKTIVKPYNYENRQYQAVEHYTFTDYPNGGLRSTASDLMRLLKAFGGSGATQGHQLLKPETVKQMLTLQIPSLSQDMGLTLFLMNPSYNLWGHDGGEEGVATIMGINPDTQIGVIILTNQGEADLDEMLTESYKLGLTL